MSTPSSRLLDLNKLPQWSSLPSRSPKKRKSSRSPILKKTTSQEEVAEVAAVVAEEVALFVSSPIRWLTWWPVESWAPLGPNRKRKIRMLPTMKSGVVSSPIRDLSGLSKELWSSKSQPNQWSLRSARSHLFLLRSSTKPSGHGSKVALWWQAQSKMLLCKASFSMGFLFTVKSRECKLLS